MMTTKSKTLNTIPLSAFSLQDESVMDVQTLQAATRLMIDPVALHHPSTVKPLPRIPVEIEPRPILAKQVPVANLTRPLLPESIKMYCNDYIALLGPLATDKAPLKKALKIARQDSTRTLESPSTSSVGYHAFQNERWMDRFQELVEFYEREGHFNVPYKSNTTLFQWVKRQRHQFKLRSMGEHSNLTMDRIQQLDKIGFVWNSHLAAWNDKFQELKEFKMIHGHCFVPCSYKGNSKLSTWIKRQRRQYRKFIAGQQSTLDSARIEKLEKLGLVWDYYAGKDKDTPSDEE